MKTEKRISWLYLALLFDALAVASFLGRQPVGGIALSMFGVQATILFLWGKPTMAVPNTLTVRTQEVKISKRLDLSQLSEQVSEWSRRNFGPGTQLGYHSLLGAIEEAGELAEVDNAGAAPLMIALGRLSHSHIKQLQHIRGTSDKHISAAKDAIGDALIYLADYCSMREFDFQQIVEDTWNQVRQRDWVKYPKTGLPPAPAEDPCPVNPAAMAGTAMFRRRKSKKAVSDPALPDPIDLPAPVVEPAEVQA